MNDASLPRTVGTSTALLRQVPAADDPDPPYALPPSCWMRLSSRILCVGRLAASSSRRWSRRERRVKREGMNRLGRGKWMKARRSIWQKNHAMIGT